VSRSGVSRSAIDVQKRWQWRALAALLLAVFARDMALLTQAAAMAEGLQRAFSNGSMNQWLLVQFDGSVAQGVGSLSAFSFWSQKTVLDSGSLCLLSFACGWSMANTGQSGVPEQSRELSLAELATESGVPERTIRYYIARGLIGGPARSGRGAVYTGEHLERLQEIRRQQRQGLTLAEIERRGEAGAPPRKLPEPELWGAYTLAPDVVVQVRSGGSPWRVRQVKSALDRLARELENSEDKKVEQP
jgi:DNA-binding transcriptional MerR regulator